MGNMRLNPCYRVAQHLCIPLLLGHRGLVDEKLRGSAARTNYLISLCPCLLYVSFRACFRRELRFCEVGLAIELINIVFWWEWRSAWFLICLQFATTLSFPLTIGLWDRQLFLSFFQAHGLFSPFSKGQKSLSLQRIIVCLKLLNMSFEQRLHFFRSPKLFDYPVQALVLEL